MWTYGQAQRDVFDQLTALRTTTVGGRNYDVQTYIVGMGDSLANASSIAALNRMAELGGGYPTAFVGSSAESLQRAFQDIVGDIQAKTSAASSVALNTGSWTTGSALYQAKFNSSDWSGSLLNYAVASSGAISAASTWDAGAQIKAQHWNTGRAILTYKPSAAAGLHGIPFRWPALPATPGATELDVSQTTALNQTPGGGSDAFGEHRLRFLRGDFSYESRSCASPPCAAPQFRNRAISPLGDIINSSPYYVGAPNFGYYDDFETARYSAFVAAYRNRTPVIYVGANDGMLHAINAIDRRRDVRLRAVAGLRRPAEADRPRVHPPLLRRRLADGRRRLLQRRLAHPARRRHARRRQGRSSRSTSPTRAASPRPTRRASCAGSSRTPTSATCSASRCWSRRTTAAGR